MCQYAQNCGTDFRKFYFKIFEILRLDLVSAAASAELSKPKDLTTVVFDFD